jgi:hypothetical protein
MKRMEKTDQNTLEQRQSRDLVVRIHKFRTVLLAVVETSSWMVETLSWMVETLPWMVETLPWMVC